MADSPLVALSSRPRLVRAMSSVSLTLHLPICAVKALRALSIRLFPTSIISCRRRKRTMRYGFMASALKSATYPLPSTFAVPRLFVPTATVSVAVARLNVMASPLSKPLILMRYGPLSNIRCFIATVSVLSTVFPRCRCYVSASLPTSAPLWPCAMAKLRAVSSCSSRHRLLTASMPMPPMMHVRLVSSTYSTLISSAIISLTVPRFASSISASATRIAVATSIQVLFPTRRISAAGESAIRSIL